VGRVLVRQVLFLLGLAFLPAIGQALYYRGTVSWQQRRGAAAAGSGEEAKNWGGAVLGVDARAEEPFAKAHVPGALRLDEDGWDTLLPSVLAAWSPERKVVVYCSRETCNASHAVAERLRHEVQLKNIYVLQGGWEEWENKK